MKSQILRFIPLIVMAVMMCHQANAQINNYAFSSSSGTFTSISSSGTPLTLSPDANNGRTTPLLFSTVFPFEYEGKQAYSLSMSANGFMGLSFASATTPLSTLQAAVGTPFTSSFTASLNLISPFGANLLGNAGTTTYCYYQVDGTAPSRVLTLEWVNFSITGSGDILVPAQANFQVKLHEGSNIVDFVYGTFSAGGRTVSTTVQIGLKGASTNAYNMNAVAGTDWTNLSGAGANTSSVTVGAGSNQLPVSGQTLRFTPEVACSGAPSAGTAAKSTISFCTSGSFGLSLSNFQKNVYTSFQWQVSNDGSAGWANTGANDTVPLAYATPVITSTKYYRCKATCLASGDSSFSNVIEALIGDTINPAITAASDIEVSNGLGICGASVAVPNAVATDNCTVQSISYVISGATTGSGTGQVGTFTFSKGVSTIDYTVTDAVGLTSTASMTVTVNDTEAPVIIGSNQTFSTDAGQCTAAASVADATITDNCGVQSISYVISGASTGSGSGQVGTFTFNKGSSTVTYTATDAVGNSTTASITVTINDNEAPAMVCKNISVTLDAAGTASIVAGDLDNGTSDNCSFSLSASKTSFDCSNTGDNTVVLTATDASGNTSSCNATVTVIDNIAPVANCKNITINLDVNGAASIVGSDIDDNSSDICGIASRVASKTTFGCGDVGANTVVLTVTDNNGNSSTCSATVTVVDNIAPVANCKNITVTLDGSGNASIVASDIDDNSTDACSFTISASKTSFTCADIGANNVVLTVTDASGNSSTCTAVVTVQNILAAPASISGNLTGCLAGVAGSTTFSTPEVATATSYVWSAPAGMTISSGQGTTNITVTWTAAAIQAGITGQLCVLASNSCSQTAAYCGNVSYQVAAPVTPGSISGPGKLCPGVQATYSIASVARATSYSWTLPANMSVVSGAGTNVLVVAVEAGYSGGSISVTASNVCGTSSSRSKALVLNNPATPSAVSGQKEGLCNQSGSVYSIPAVPNATGYTWSVSGGTIQSGQGTTSITVDFGSFTSGSVSVYASNGCGNSSTRITTVKGAPGRPDVISGTTTYCTGSTSAHGVATVTGADNYNWTMTSGGYITGGNGTKNISVQWLSTASSSQSIAVNASNACGAGTNRVLSGISVSTCPRIGESTVSSLGLNAMPNPTSDRVTLRFNSEEAGAYTVTLFDLAGRTIMSNQLQAYSGVNQVELGLGSYAAGTYLVRVWNGSSSEQLRIILE